MSSTSAPVKARSEAKVLLRSTSFQKLCSIPYNFKIEAIKSYREHIKTIIKFLKVATRSYLVSVYFKMVSIILINYYAIAQRNVLKISYLATSGMSSHAERVTEANGIGGKTIVKSKHQPQPKNGKHLTLGGLLDNPIVRFQAFLTYSCIGYIGIQMAWLANALFLSADIPLGLIFLMLDLGYMGMIIFKIALKDSNLAV